jgi:hypothetical protein
MFKFLERRELRIRVAPTDQSQNETIETDERTYVEPERIAEIAKDLLKHASIAVGGIIVLVGAVATAREIAVKKTKSADSEEK